MRPHRLRALMVPGAIAIACAAVVPVQMATAAPTPANGGFYGVWTLKSWDINGQVLPCPVEFSPVPALPIVCGHPTYLKLFRSGRYDTNLPGLEANEADDGAFVVANLGPRKGNVIVFEYDGFADFPFYRLSVPKSGSKAPKKMAISTAAMHGTTKTTIAMNFVRYTG